MRTLTIILSSIMLGACSGILEGIPEPAAEAPTIKSATADIKRVAAEAKLPDPLEVAGPIEAKPATVAPWIVCVRSSTQAPANQTYALFYRDIKLISSRPAAIVDRCDTQAFVRL
ncbi:hypothetical protein [Rhodopseudomonas palustris]|uniref:Lipoprotein n=1 Tax=Rhodopseudomonas palustris TaxID=1076 RepID=A0A418V3Z5_RHOPL|nr:hypothetical protein [Rhodopseudomonas palustris]RJF70770.1 hypothetical protein D4Q52_15750 [Rhodopseudomonas palustris]